MIKKIKSIANPKNFKLSNIYIENSDKHLSRYLNASLFYLKKSEFQKKSHSDLNHKFTLKKDSAKSSNQVLNNDDTNKLSNKTENIENTKKIETENENEKENENNNNNNNNENEYGQNEEDFEN